MFGKTLAKSTSSAAEELAILKTVTSGTDAGGHCLYFWYELALNGGTARERVPDNDSQQAATWQAQSFGAIGFRNPKASDFVLRGQPRQLDIPIVVVRRPSQAGYENLVSVRPIRRASESDLTRLAAKPKRQSRKISTAKMTAATEMEELEEKLYR